MNKYLISLSFAFVAVLASGLHAQTPSAKMDASEIYENAVKSVVLVICGNADGSSAQGSGVILREDGLIATNFHVCGGATHGRVKLRNGDIYDDVSIVETDERKDVMILKIKAMGLPVLKTADSDALRVGQNVYAIGAPLGLEGSITPGIVSSIRPASEMFSWAEGFRVIQISTPVTHGSSGCPLLNEFGQVVGLVFAGRREGQNLNAAIPINYVSPFVSSARQGVQLKTFTGFVPTKQAASQPLAKADKLEDIAGVYSGRWASDRYDVSGYIVIRVVVTNGIAHVSASFTGSEYFSRDEFTTTFTSVGAGVWRMDYVGKKSKIKGTGLFQNRQFVGDYKFKKFIWTDVGRWVLTYQS